MGRYDKMCDMWSVGVIMYILLSGRAPIIGASDRETVAKIREGRWVLVGSVWGACSGCLQEGGQGVACGRPESNDNPLRIAGRRSRTSVCARRLGEGQP